MLHTSGEGSSQATVNGGEESHWTGRRCISAFFGISVIGPRRGPSPVKNLARP